MTETRVRFQTLEFVDLNANLKKEIEIALRFFHF